MDNKELWLEYLIKNNEIDGDIKELKLLKKDVLNDNRINKFLNDIADFHSILVRNHKNPDLPIYKLLFLLEIGLDTDIYEIDKAIQEIMKHKDNNGVYQSLTNIPKHYGGTGKDQFGWCLCDAPLLLLALVKAGINYEQHLEDGVNYLVKYYESNGFPCTVSEELGKFRGPGKKNDCCPYATLNMLKLLINISQYNDNNLIIQIANNLLDLWKNSINEHPYMFYMGNDFRKLKAPIIWYDLVNVCDVLSQIENIHGRKEFIEMINIIRHKQDALGNFTPESVYQKCKDWEFGQKKVPSPYLTYKCKEILNRVNPR